MKTNTMKTLRLSILFLFASITIQAQTQKGLTGLWTGKMTLTNDSVTERIDQSFELALTEYRGKVYGYSRRTFLVRDTLYYVLKRVKGKIDGDIAEITDDEFISYNFPGKLDKGVKVTYTFHMNEHDSTWSLDGNWKTNQVKRKFYAMSGKVSLAEEKDLSKAEIFPHLDELKLGNDVPFYADSKKPPVQNNPVATTTPKQTPPVVEKKKKEKAPPKQTETEVAKVDPPKNEVKQNKNNESLATVTNKPAEDADKNNKKTETVAAINESEKKDPIVNTPVQTKKEAQTIAANEKKKEIEIATAKPEQKKVEPSLAENKKPEEKKPAPIVPVAAALLKERKTVEPQIITYASDSLEFALYDNGEVDGDTVSVIMNGEVIVAKQGLKTTATRKTIHILPGQNEFTIVLYAENLGKYPPNTGLLVVYDGEERYQVRFSADLQQNAAVVFRRKK